MKFILILWLLLALSACHTSRNEVSTYEVTPIPFNIDNFTEDQRRVIREGNDADTSLNLMRSRPVMFQVVGATNKANESRGPGRIDLHADILIYGLGEARDGQLVDYGWLENVETGARVWEMTFENTEYAGGDARNRKRVSRITLPPGVYQLHYRTNDSHAFTAWEAAAPEYDHLYGITMFNMTALPGIDERLKEAGLPVLSTSLERPYDKVPPTTGG